ncbi:MAG: hypothetical protein LBK99_05600 [Opitutaceae bacterium]|jgi:hypothetical protein|nr:hypothetical protein [Opitutaceae bacterium]
MPVRLDEDLVRKNDNLTPQKAAHLGILPVSDSDYALLPEIHDSPDHIQTGEPRKDGSVTIEFFKRIGHVFYVADSVRFGKRYLNVMRFVRLPKDSPQIPGLLRATPHGDLALTSETSSGMATTTPGEGANVNPGDLPPNTGGNTGANTVGRNEFGDLPAVEPGEFSEQGLRERARVAVAAAGPGPVGDIVRRWAAAGVNLELREQGRSIVIDFLRVPARMGTALPEMIIGEVKALAESMGRRIEFATTPDGSPVEAWVARGFVEDPQGLDSRGGEFPSLYVYYPEAFSLETYEQRMAEEERAKREQREQREKMRERADQRLEGGAGNQTVDMFGGGDMSLFDQAQQRQQKAQPGTPTSQSPKGARLLTSKTTGGAVAQKKNTTGNAGRVNPSGRKRGTEASPEPSSAPGAYPQAGTQGATAASANVTAEVFTPEPVDDPNFSALPMELPELVRFALALSGGQYPRIREKLQALRGRAAGAFIFAPGVPGGRIELRADLFALVSAQEKASMLQRAVEFADAMEKANGKMDKKKRKQLIEEKFNESVRIREQAALRENPVRAMAVLAHEIGHWFDHLPEGMLRQRGNLFGHIGALYDFMRNFMPVDPTSTMREPTAREQKEMYKRARERVMRDVGKWVSKRIHKEIPIFEDVKITADDITKILKTTGEQEFPQLYEWFQRLPQKEKVAVLRAAMKGIVTPEAAAASGVGRKQVGVQVVTGVERVWKGGRPSKAEILKLFEEMFIAEIERRGLVRLSDVKAEALAVMQWWQGNPNVSPYYTRSAAETYAEVFSATMNNPSGVAKRAPKLWKLWNNYMTNRPKAAKMYQKIQDSIRSGSYRKERTESLLEMWRKHEQAADLLVNSWRKRPLREQWHRFLRVFGSLLIRKGGYVQGEAMRRLRKTPGDTLSQNLLRDVKKHLYRLTMFEAFARDVGIRVQKPLFDANMSQDDLALYMYHSRVANDPARQGVANTDGFSPKTSRDELDAMRQRLGNRQFVMLEQVHQALREVYTQHILKPLIEADLLSPEMQKAVMDRVFYAPFSKALDFNPSDRETIEGLIKQAYGEGVTAKLFHGVGFFGQIRSPFLALVQKSFSLNVFIRRQMALKSMVRFLEAEHPDLIRQADRQWDGRHWAFREIDQGEVTTIYIVESGKSNAYHVPKWYADQVFTKSFQEIRSIKFVNRSISWFKAMKTELNPGFWPFNFIRDMGGSALNVRGGWKLVRYLPRAYMAARAIAKMKPNALADEALRRGMFITSANFRDEDIGNSTRVDKILARYGQSPLLLRKMTRDMSGWDRVLNVLARAWHGYASFGKRLERTVKISGMLHVDNQAQYKNLPEWKKQRIVLERIGSPDFLERGELASLADMGMLFYNPWVQGIHAAVTSIREDPVHTSLKYAAFMGVPAMALVLFEYGLLSLGLPEDEEDDLREKMRSIPENDKRRGWVLPLWWSDREQKKVAYLVLPMPDQMRSAHIALRGFAQGMLAAREVAMEEKDASAGQIAARAWGRTPHEGVRSALSFGVQDAPGMNPVLSEIGVHVDYWLLDRNPFDAFTGREILNRNVFDARRGGAELAKRTFSRLGGDVVYKYRPREGVQTKAERVLGYGLISNTIGRFIKVSNRGQAEALDAITAPVQVDMGRMRYVADQYVQQAMFGGGKSIDIPEADRKYFAYPGFAEYVKSRFEAAALQATAPEIRRLKSSGTSRREKLAIEQEIFRRYERARQADEAQ